MHANQLLNRQQGIPLSCLVTRIHICISVVYRYLGQQIPVTLGTDDHEVAMTHTVTIECCMHP